MRDCREEGEGRHLDLSRSSTSGLLMIFHSRNSVNILLFLQHWKVRAVGQSV